MARYTWTKEENDKFIDAVNDPKQTRENLFEMYKGHDFLNGSDDDQKKSNKFNARIKFLLKNGVFIRSLPKKIRVETVDAKIINKRSNFSDSELKDIKERIAKAQK